MVPLPEADSTADEDPLPLIAAVLACALLMATAAAARRRLRHAEAAEGPAGDRWSEAEGDIPPPPWSVPPAPWSTPQRAAEQEKPSPRGDGRALKPPGSARRHGHPERPGSSQPRKRD